MFSDPLSITYNGSPVSLPRVGVDNDRSKYESSDRQFSVEIEKSRRADGTITREVKLTRVSPDSTPADAFDPYRRIPNGVSLVFTTDEFNSFSSTDLPLLRTALLALVDTTFQGRILGDEK